MIINIVIDANIGAGKTTLLRLLQRYLKSSENIVFNFFEENVESWMSEGWLQKYYSNIPKYAASFQTRVLLSHIQQRKDIIEINKNQSQDIIINICERSAITTVNVFSKMLVDDGTMDKMEMDLHNMILEMFNYEKPDLLIFLDTNYELAYQRLRERSRDGELKISMEYLEKLENMYKQQLTTLANNIINVDGSLTEIEIGEKCADLIKGFV